uniref:Uncharacterized protein n=1 Tax=Strombidium rassoulzadegani TaxID=1082188 RepID=A0A7S3CJM0_9SPIT|mmetsp:Transcript_10112/g.17073  ORF Transcript_10112/g.17073 Transcript_10112/m.17073 type:complete len:206 (+) Transcript_10112:1039-1656(+)
MIIYDIVFMIQGVVDTVFEEEQSLGIEYMAESVFGGPLVFFSFTQALSVFSPSVNHDTGFLYFYPLYEQKWLQNYFVLGSFSWVYLLTWTSKYILNSKFNDTVFKLFVQGSMFAYLSHYLWIVLCNQYVVRRLDLPYSTGVFVTFFFTQVCIVACLYLSHQLSSCLRPKRNSEGEALPRRSAQRRSLDNEVRIGDPESQNIRRRV